KTDQNLQHVRFNAQYLIYPSPNKTINVFFGAGPLFELSRSEISGLGQWRVTKFWKLGLSGVLGVEWFAAEWISFLSEYASTFTYDWQTSERTYDSTRFKYEDDRQSLSFTYISVKFGLSVYW
ncbi:MAG: hypothetical protein ABIA59_04385, partial [Candidatus Latescibacterota bacterium]